MANTGIIPSDNPSLLPNIAEVAPEIEAAGKAFGTLLLRTGNAVAESQRRLDKASADTTVALAKTLVDVVAVREIGYNDDGTINPDLCRDIVSKMPLVDFMDPVFYKWPEVHLQGVFMAEEFGVASQSSISAKSTTGAEVSTSLTIKFGKLAMAGYERKINASSINQLTSNTTQTASESYSYGNIRMNARLVPRTDVGVPKPLHVVRGPRLNFFPANPADVTTATPQTRTLDLEIKFTRYDGTPIGGSDTGKSIAIDTGGLTWSFLDNGNKKAGGDPRGCWKTDEAGVINIRLTRTFDDGTKSDEAGTQPVRADRSPASFVISARIGMVSNSIVVTF